MCADKRQFEWTPEQRRSIRTWQRQLRPTRDRIAEIVKRFDESLPQLCDEARQVADPALQIDGVLRLESRRVKQAIPYEEVAALVAAAEAATESWDLFIRRADVQEAIRVANRGIQREKRKQREAQRQSLTTAVESKEFQTAVEKLVQQRFENARYVAEMAHSMCEYGKPDDLPILVRCVLVDVVRGLYEFDHKKQDAFASMLAESPPSSVRELLRHAATFVLKNSMIGAVKAPTFAWALNPSSHFQSIEGSAFSFLMDRMKKWKADGIEPDQIDARLFDVCGMDFSLSAVPD